MNFTHLIDLAIMKRCLMGWKEGKFGHYSTKWRNSTVILSASTNKIPKKLLILSFVILAGLCCAS